MEGKIRLLVNNIINFAHLNPPDMSHRTPAASMIVKAKQLTSTNLDVQ